MDAQKIVDDGFTGTAHFGGSDRMIDRVAERPDVTVHGSVFGQIQVFG